MQTKQKIQFPELPLAVYREMAAHLRQIQGVEIELIPQSSEEFDYKQSQISGLLVEYTSNSLPGSPQWVEQILAYYHNRYLA